MKKTFSVILLLITFNNMINAQEDTSSMTDGVFDLMIVGGTEVDPACPDCKYPFMVSLKKDNFGHWCGGSLIREDWVLTAAHCVTENNFSDVMDPDDLEVDIGMHNVNSTEGSETISIDEIIVHPSWNYWALDNDYALLHLNSSSSFETLQLITEDSHDNEPYMADIMGWGAIYLGGPASTELLEVHIPIDDGCGNYSPNEITENHMCAGDSNGGENTCHGDSGGPLIITNDFGEYEQVGIVSWAYGWASAGYPTVYSRIWPELDWIFSYIGDPFVVELYGDVNFDGSININDIIIVLNFILHNTEPTSEEFATADMNQDENLNILDVIQMINTILSSPS